jgi:hypothetical protein
MATTEQQVPYPKALEQFPTLRQSLLASFDNCPLSTRFDIEYGGFATHDQTRGRIFHQTAARCLDEMATQQEERIEIDVAIAILEEVMRQHDVDLICHRCDTPTEPRPEGRFYCPTCDKERESSMDSLPMRQVKDLRMSVIKWAHDNTFSIENFVGSEEPLEATIGYPSDYGVVERRLTGILDALFFEGDRAIVPDWKDTWALPPQSEVSFGGYFQQRFYGLLVLRNFQNVRSVTMREVYHRWDERREAILHRDDLPDVEAEISALVERFDRGVEHNIWKPSPGKHCSFCKRPTACPIFPDARAEGAIQDEEQAKRYAAEACVAKAAYDQRMKALKAWSNRRGDVPLADAKGPRVYGYVERTSTSRPERDKLEAELRRAGVKGIDLDKLYRKKKSTVYTQKTPENGQPQPADAKIAEMLRQSLGDDD